MVPDDGGAVIGQCVVPARFCSELVHLVDEDEVGVEVFASEAGQRRAVVAPSGDLLLAGDGPGEHGPTEGAEGHESDAEFLAGGEHAALLRVTGP